ncbi:MAG: hypothetical protein QM500_19330 [Methylococcales bacterium]
MYYKKIQTSPEVWAMIKARHKDLVVFSSYSAPDGDEFGDSGICKMMTEYGFHDCDMPIIGAETTWKKHPTEEFKRDQEEHKYWICVGIDCDT